MTPQNLATIILAAGQGTRMRSRVHKVLHPVGGKAMLLHILDMLADTTGGAQPIVVVGSGADQVKAAVGDRARFAYQTQQLGTGHAVMCCRDMLLRDEGNSGDGGDSDPRDLLVLYGDVPLITAQTIAAMGAARRDGASLVVLGFTAANPTGYGRLITAADGSLDRIVEEKDASDAEKAVTLCNSGLMLMDAEWALAALDRLTNRNASGEYYLTDLVALARADGKPVATVTTDEDEVTGVNDRAGLAAVEAIFQARARAHHMADGVTFTAPDTVFLSADTVLAPDVTIEPHVVFGPAVVVESGSVIKAFSHLEGAHVHAGASIGPYARLRPGAKIGEGAKIGNFVEVKKAQLDAGVKVSHLSYIGDAQIGADANIGAGTITCNYDGYQKFQTVIGAGAFIGSNTALVAPVTVGDGAIVGAGSVLTKDTPADSLAVTRAPQKMVQGYAAKIRAKHAVRAAKKGQG